MLIRPNVSISLISVKICKTRNMRMRFSIEFMFGKMNRILIIDDDEELCELVAEYLTVEGFETKAVHDGAAGLESALVRRL